MHFRGCHCICRLRMRIDRAEVPLDGARPRSSLTAAFTNSSVLVLPTGSIHRQDAVRRGKGRISKGHPGTGHDLLLAKTKVAIIAYHTTCGNNSVDRVDEEHSFSSLTKPYRERAEEEIADVDHQIDTLLHNERMIEKRLAALQAEVLNPALSAVASENKGKRPCRKEYPTPGAVCCF
eukprot:GHVU01007370.1.p1 GENE.GHVU01007370.1~~GHVU01007370.1.p1  ORF type:complete len:178 (+),score=8.09 GHVU01007370.1:904-1437(+)